MFPERADHYRKQEIRWRALEAEAVRRDPSPASTSLDCLKARIDNLRRQGRPPFEAVMTEQTWSRLQALHCAARAGAARPSGQDVVGLRVRLKPHVRGVILRYPDGEDFEVGR